MTRRSRARSRKRCCVSRARTAAAPVWLRLGRRDPARGRVLDSTRAGWRVPPGLGAFPARRALAVMVMLPKPGDVVRLESAASVQFSGDRAITLRVISVVNPPERAEFTWVHGYELDSSGEARERREVH